MLGHLFLEVMDMSRAASLVILIIIVARILLKKHPKHLSYMLWGVVLFKLFCHFTLESKISPIPNLKPTFYEYRSEKENVLSESANHFAVPYINRSTSNLQETSQALPKQFSFIESQKGSAELSWQELFIAYGQYVWLLGICAMILYSTISAVKIHKTVSASVHLKEKIYITDTPVSPFAMGILKPKIYLPRNLNEKEQEYIILHEQFHIRRLDHIVKPIAFAALCIHWFNPLVWIAFILSCRDMEMSCDEAVIRKMGNSVKADYSASLLALSTRQVVTRGIPVDFGKGDVTIRIKNLAAFGKTKKGIAVILMIACFIFTICLSTTHQNTGFAKNDNSFSERAAEEAEIQNTRNTVKEELPLKVTVNISDYYTVSTGDPSNFYCIDENGILWGSGRNNYGQLGQGTQDYDFHGEMVKIAENVIHVDYSQKGFTIFITKDNKLYGMGNAGCGALQQYEEFDWTQYTNGEKYTVTAPLLLMEDVMYACCGRDDIVCLKKDGTVWTWGTVYVEGGYLSEHVYFIEKPKKILENASFVTGGWFNHAALLQDGTLWTWGYNSSGNCGVSAPSALANPTKVAQQVIMVWTNLAVAGYPQPGPEEISLAWTGNLKYNTAYNDISEFEDIYPFLLNNTVIQKTDGSYWVCGENVGTEEKVVHGAEGDYYVACSHEFSLCE